MLPLLHFEDFPVGRREDFGPYTVGAEQVRDFATRYDPRPALLAEPATASPWMLPAVLMRMNYDAWVRHTAAQGAPGVEALRWFRPVRAGESLTGRYEVQSARASRSRPSQGLVQYHYELLGADRTPVFSQTNVVMIARRDPSPVADDGAAVPRNSQGEPAPGQAVALGTAAFPADGIIAFARVYDPQPFHVDAAAAAVGPFGALAASGWHTAASWMAAYVRAAQDARNGLPRPGRFISVTDLRWLRPVHAGHHITFAAIPLTTERSGEAMLRGTGVDQDGLLVYAFTARMAAGDIDTAPDPS